MSSRSSAKVASPRNDIKAAQDKAMDVAHISLWGTSATASNSTNRIVGLVSSLWKSRQAQRGLNCHKRHSFRHEVEGLENRTLLSLSASQPVSPAWFERLGQSGQIARASELNSSSEIQTLAWNGRTVEARKDEWIVQLSADTLRRTPSVAKAAGLFTDAPFSVDVVEGLGLTGSLLIRTSKVPSDAVLSWFSRRSVFASFEPNAVLYTSATPNDPSYTQLYGLNNTGQTGGTADADIDAPEAWDLSTGSRSIVVGVIDTGVDYNHPDLAANIWTNPDEIPGDGIDNDHDGFVDDVHGYDFVNNDGDPMDDHGHGTHVAGTIAAAGNNGKGVTGVNWASSIMAFLPPQQNLWVRFGSGRRPRLCNRASFAIFAVRKPYDFLVTSFTLLFRPSTAPAETIPLARNQLRINDR